MRLRAKSFLFTEMHTQNIWQPLQNEDHFLHK